jgi:outer membrane protein OmpA-like peptidoglycan-associated protein
MILNEPFIPESAQIKSRVLLLHYFFYSPNVPPYMKRILTLLIPGFFLLSLADLAAQEFRVQIAAYAEKMPDEFFREKGIDNVVVSTDQMGMFRYYASSCTTRDDAEKIQQEMVAKGFLYSTVIDLEEQRALSGAYCPYLHNGMAYAQILKGSGNTRNIFFDFGKHILTAESKEVLDGMCTTLKENQNLKLKIHGYTDGVGNATSNMELAGNRARSARNYLISKGIRADRMFLKVFGEAEPLAPNSEDVGDGTREDLPENRKWNRRVMLVLFEGEDETDDTPGGK